MDSSDFLDSKIGSRDETGELKDLTIIIIESSFDVTHSLDLSFPRAKKLMDYVEQLGLHYNVDSATNTPIDYKDRKDVVSVLEEHVSYDRFVNYFIFNIVKYTKRDAKKDAVESEVQFNNKYTESLLNFTEYPIGNGTQYKKKIHTDFCFLYFSEYLPSEGIVVINPDVTSHITENRVKNYKPGNILLEHTQLTVVLDLTDLQQANNFQKMLDIPNDLTESCIFKSDNITTDLVIYFFHREISCEKIKYMLNYYIILYHI
ncbi:hypothetical protein [Staphylococcus phage vB_SauH_DELF3]|nr:hypothetical protein [Staphylococcus phage vB_SauH_DELF3]